MESEAFGEDGVITVLEAFDQAGLERDAAIAVGHPTGARRTLCILRAHVSTGVLYVPWRPYLDIFDQL